MPSTDQDDDEDELQIMHRQREGWKTQSLQRGNLLALSRYKPAQCAVKQERRNAEEDDGNSDGHHLLLVQFVLEKPV